MKTHFVVAAALNFLLASANSHAEVAVRHAATSEVEFQALAQALGYTTAAEFLTAKRNIPGETSMLFKMRIADAEQEWSQRKSLGRSTPAIDRFLELSLDADWDATERNSIVAFLVRKIALDKTLESPVFERIVSFIDENQSVDFSDAPDSEIRWRKFRSFASQNRISFASMLPTDIAAIVANGRVISREAAQTFAVPRTDMRITLISNTYQPTSFRISGNTMELPTLQRRAWMNEDCSLNKFPNAFGEVELKALGASACAQNTNASSKTEVAESPKATVARFGLSEKPGAPLEPPSESSSALMKKPWFWGALGVIALGAVIAVQSQGRSAAVQPTESAGW